MGEPDVAARNVAKKILAWARENRALADDVSTPPIAAQPGVEILPTGVSQEEQDASHRAKKALERIKIVQVAVDDAHGRVIVLTKNQVSSSTASLLPNEIDGVAVDYQGHALVEANPPILPQAATGGAPRCFLHGHRLACGSSLTSAQSWGAGSLGALIELADGTICGLTNNHVTGACNHTQVGMHILCPAPFDADPAHPAPYAIGKHTSFIPLASGDPRQVQLQDHDVAIFEVVAPDRVSSMQGAGFYDTPTDIADPIAGMKVKKVGRTTGLTSGEVIGVFPTPLGIPYQSDRFKSTVYFRDAWAVRTSTGDPFSMGGDSGSLVVTQDGTKAVGLIFAGANNGSVSYIIPISGILTTLGAKLVQGHNV